MFLQSQQKQTVKITSCSEWTMEAAVLLTPICPFLVCLFNILLWRNQARKFERMYSDIEIIDSWSTTAELMCPYKLFLSKSNAHIKIIFPPIFNEFWQLNATIRSKIMSQHFSELPPETCSACMVYQSHSTFRAKCLLTVTNIKTAIPWFSVLLNLYLWE